jgi:3-methyladenine DNA glycosylase AlkD
MTYSLAQIERQLRSMGDATRAQNFRRFFRTGPGEYGEGDQFLGLTVPQVRALVSQYSDLPLPQVRALLRSRWHEARLLALLILVRDFERGNERQRAAVAKLYLANLKWVNNWDLVDCSAHLILGPHLARGERGLLDKLSSSADLWKRRVAMLSTFHYIRQGQFTDALRIARRLLHDDHDLIHKAVGWMLREIGKRNEAKLRAFLDRHAAHMPRTMLRYAIERLPPGSRSRYMGMKAYRLPKS